MPKTRDARPPRGPGADPEPPATPPASSPAAGRYWRANVRLLLSLLLVWFAVSFGFGILLVDVLNQIRIPGTGFRLGFWFAQQGSIYVFVLLIFVYVWRMNRLDADYGVAEE